MKSLLETFFAVLGAIAPLVWVLHSVYCRGLKKGRESGWRDADNWWLGVENEVGLTREKIWREEE